MIGSSKDRGIFNRACRINLEVRRPSGRGTGNRGDDRSRRRGAGRPPSLRLDLDAGSADHRSNEKVATSESISISVVMRLPGIGPPGVKIGPLTRFLKMW